MTTKKSVALIIVLMMVLSALAGCSSTKTNTPGEATKAPASVEENAGTSADKTPDGETSAEREHATFSLLNMAAATTTVDPWKDTPVGKYLAEKTNVDLEIEYLVGSDVRQKASLLIAAGEYPDMMTTADASGDFKAAGAFIPLNDYIANSTNMKDCFTNSQMKLMTQEDGNIYWFGTHASENAVYPTAGYYLSMDLLKQADYPEVKYFDQWQQLIIDYVAANPTYNGQSTIGVSEPTEAWRASAVQYGGSRFLVGYQNDGLTVVDPDTLEAKVIMDQDFQKEFCKMLNTMWNLGIADPEMFMQTDEQYQAKIGSGRIAGLYDQRSMIQVGLDALEAADPSRMLVAFPVVLEGVTTERYRGPRNFTGGSGFGITVSCKDPDRAFQFLDDLASEDCQIVLRWGVEGTDYSVGEDGGLVVTSSLGRMSFTADCLTDELPAQSSFDVVLGIRPEKIGICCQEGDGAIPASVYATQPAGSETTIHLKMDDGSVVLAKEMGIRNYAVDQVVHVRIDPDKLNVFAKDTGRLIKMAVPD